MKGIRKTISILILGAVGGILAQFSVTPLLVRINFLGIASIWEKLGNQPRVITRVEERTVVIPKADYFSEAIAKSQDSIVAVQSFTAGRLIRSGSGITLTRDGLIATINSVVPTEATTIQVLIAGKIFTAKVVSRNTTYNIALISVTENNFPVASLGTVIPELGRSVALISRLTEPGKDYLFMASALVAQTDDAQKTFKLSTPFDANLYGAAIVAEGGVILGMVDFRNTKTTPLYARLISEVLNTYLTP